ncbi:hypothetical protein [Bartonella choladocola]|uniref:Uncharacterized protein n=1 Tax=Bartonella choladocola TaxID=2750995 RepID=A0A1U9MEI3_9HYPH|nr:hypothetical protein [Bartonella choladocola]AQT46347.1 hypothetical protein BBC0122_002070 [Bartonella choladocola]
MGGAKLGDRLLPIKPDWAFVIGRFVIDHFVIGSFVGLETKADK